MMRLFGKAPPTSSTKESLKKLREAVDVLEKREAFLQNKVDAELKYARINSSKNRKAAITALKKKKIYEGQIEKLNGSKLTLEQQLAAVEESQVALQTLDAMKIGAIAMKNIHGKLDADSVDNIMDDIRNSMDTQTDISTAISTPLTNETTDDDDFEQELLALQDQDLNEYLTHSYGKKQEIAQDQIHNKSKPILNLPSVPTNNLSEEEEFQSLEISMLT